MKMHTGSKQAHTPFCKANMALPILSAADKSIQLRDSFINWQLKMWT